MPTNITPERTDFAIANYSVLAVRRDIFGGGVLINPGDLQFHFPIVLNPNDSISIDYLLNHEREVAVLTQYDESTGVMLKIGSEELPIRLISHLWHGLLIINFDLP